MNGRASRPRGLSERALAAALREHYGLEDADVVPSGAGNDADSWSFRVAAGGRGYFLKARSAHVAEAGTAVPLWLARRGLRGIPAPIPTSTGAASVALGAVRLTLQPLLAGRPAAEVGLSAAQWRRLGELVRGLHAAAGAGGAPPGARGETFTPTRRALIDRVDSLVASGATGPVAELAPLWLEKRPTILALAARGDALGRRLRGAAPPPVLCHGDLHTFNVLVDDAGELWLVDWDEATFGPRERDLMFVVGGIHRRLVGPHDTEAFLRGYGEVEIDETALEYYRVAWALQDIAADAEQAALAPGSTSESRARGREYFALLFEPGAIVDIAIARAGSP